MLTTAASWLQDEEDDMKGATGRGPAYRRRLAGKTVFSAREEMVTLLRALP